MHFSALLVDLKQIPLICPEWVALEAARRSAYEAPESHAVLRVIELEQYRNLPRHQPGFIASFLGLSRAEEERCIEILLNSRQLIEKGGRLIPSHDGHGR